MHHLTIQLDPCRDLLSAPRCPSPRSITIDPPWHHLPPLSVQYTSPYPSSIAKKDTIPSPPLSPPCEESQAGRPPLWTSTSAVSFAFPIPRLVHQLRVSVFLCP
ncbi:hypothetical protein LX32DRAFT_45695 [Colletotrichum zoysiae]|uniref:Uncharacterized protein n=1 Tax=Colletotrichum zoysiae TaxID=1216348 RepID=A0AAD9HDA9_9PEZI|nr:hypothetical protein LX32DRAFT_45695 [Colletotrichum zoysiae]